MNELLVEFNKYIELCNAKREDSLSFKRWIKEVYDPPKGCTKCQRIKKTLTQKLR